MDDAALIGLGTNLPFADVAGPALLAHALAALEARGLAPLAVSSVWLTGAWPPSDQPDYHNAAAAVDPQGLSPQALYAVLSEVEQAFGRERRARWEARTLDLDLLGIGSLKGDFDGIRIPHPRLHERAFVLAPLAEIAPDWLCPGLGKTPVELLAAVPEGQSLRRLGPLAPF